MTHVVVVLWGKRQRLAEEVYMIGLGLAHFASVVYMFL